MSKQYGPVPEFPTVGSAAIENVLSHFKLTDTAAENVYRELLTTETTYLHQLFIIGPDEMQTLLNVYDGLSAEELQGAASKEQLEDIFDKLTALRNAQVKMLAVLQQKDPQRWAAEFANLAAVYRDYVTTAGGAVLPLAINTHSAVLNSPHNTNTGNASLNLSSILITPIQRGTRIELLIFDLIKKSPEDQKAQFQPFYESALQVNRSIQEGMVLREVNKERELLKEKMIQASVKPSIKTLGPIVEGLSLSSLSAQEWKSHFAQMSFAKLPKADFAKIQAICAAQKNAMKIKIERAQSTIDLLTGKELITQQNDIKKYQATLAKLEEIEKILTEKMTVDKEKRKAITLAEPVIPKPTKSQMGDVKVKIENAGTENRRAIKSQFRNKSAEFLQSAGLSPSEFTVVETKSALGKTAGFIVKENGQDALFIKVKKSGLTIQPLHAQEGIGSDKLGVINKLAHALNQTATPPEIVSNNSDKIRRLNELAINSNHSLYSLNSEEKKTFNKQLEHHSTGNTAGVFAPIIHVNCAGNTQDQILTKFNAIIAQGLFVPKLIPQPGLPIPYLSGAVVISTEVPLLAIKQYEAALNAGLNPEFTAQAKKKVGDFLRKQLDNNAADFQMTISIPPGTVSISGQQVLARLKKASEDGFVVNLNTQATLELKQHVASLPANDSTLQYDLPTKHSHTAQLVNHLLGMGLLPSDKTLGSHSLQVLMKEDMKLNPLPLVINSGNIQRDFSILKASYEQLRRSAKITDANSKALKEFVKKGSLPIIDLQNFTAKEQIANAKELAQVGIGCTLSNNIVAGIAEGERNIFISSKNAAHARDMFEQYLNLGLIPIIQNRRLVELSASSGDYINIQGDNPKALIERIIHCAKEGLKIQLSPDQKEMMKKYCEKHDVSLPIHGHGWHTIKHNVEVANQLGMMVGPITKLAKATCLREQARAKEHNERLPQIEMLPIQKTQTRFFRSDTKVGNPEKTLTLANELMLSGLPISLHSLEAMKKEIEQKTHKTTWFGLSKTPTNEAIKAQLFLQNNWQKAESNAKLQIELLTGKTSDELRTAADEMSPSPVKLEEKAKPLASVKTVYPKTSNVQRLDSHHRQAPVIRSNMSQTESATVGSVSATPIASQVVTVDTILESFKAIQKQAFEDMQIGYNGRFTNPNRIFTNTKQICDTITGTIKKEAPEKQLEMLREILQQVANGNPARLAGERPSMHIAGIDNTKKPFNDYVIDDSIKKMAKDFAERIPTQAVSHRLQP
ncbi:RhoGEF domain-containing protein [Candidatus Berkiella aquae]|uniref:RhoGEF domain protein n=1 Tax=Candidatus Berkiella aquae TaxID=295108 RepID=A0A0Q9YJZ2_9GAMM|nr:RhoGEF domain-containing protein [Candidatus Berkiella aquae]MCS5710049.1 hypothetical protein [Candidatus Berkiella aquae]